MALFVPRKLSHAVLASALLLGSAAPAWCADSIEPLLGLIAERNAIGDQVALSKWESGKPVQDAAREAVVLSGVREQAPEHGLDPDDAARFFGMQIESNKLVQYQLLDEWRLRGNAPDEPRPDLAALRKRLDKLQADMLDALQASAPARNAPDCPISTARAVKAYVQAHQLDQVHQMALIRSLGDFCR
ncbi:chorismate mutase [Paramesorhizobium deserti]|uniref:Chorismate mutase n=1 Tax=Paramesorhizobium deserti TaxID=1494590 RepID=A0A135HUM3_9HYPH|nr:chorismate mutase [Paramesorhizobium deserti]KXF76871.1 chorismate mutase [Paramesorhizobium deserti]